MGLEFTIFDTDTIGGNPNEVETNPRITLNNKGGIFLNMAVAEKFDLDKTGIRCVIFQHPKQLKKWYIGFPENYAKSLLFKPTKKNNFLFTRKVFVVQFYKSVGYESKSPLRCVIKEEADYDIDFEGFKMDLHSITIPDF